MKASSGGSAAAKPARASVPNSPAKPIAKVVKSPAKIAKAVATKAVTAVTKKVSNTVSSLTGAGKTEAKPDKAARDRQETATPVVATRTASSPKTTGSRKEATSSTGFKSTGAKASVRKSGSPKQVSPKPNAAETVSIAKKKTTARRPAGILATGARNGAPPAEFSGSESFRPEEDIQELNPTDVREHYFQEHRGGPPPAPAARELPNEYGDTKIVLLVRDPEWVYAYWEINDAKREELKLSRNGHDRRTVIRLYKITARNWPSEGAHYFFDLDVSPYALNWYIKLPEPAQQWCAELGVFDEHNSYISICRSNTIGTPRNTISEETDSEWMVVEETFRKLSKLGGAGGRQVPGLSASRGASETLLRQLQRQVSGMLRVEGGGLSSGSLYSGSLVEDRGQVAVAKDFWLQVHTEVILYGSTEPDASVTVQERPVKLDADGRFSVRFTLPDGEQVLRVHAVNSDGDMERTITPVVRKTTREK
ncbi:MAG: DUF4912 domain-containing protein [Candidatus Sumerlaeaceae bacterium]